MNMVRHTLHLRQSTQRLCLTLFPVSIQNRTTVLYYVTEYEVDAA